VTGLKTG